MGNIDLQWFAVFLGTLGIGIALVFLSPGPDIEMQRVSFTTGIAFLGGAVGMGGTSKLKATKDQSAGG